MSDKFQGVGGPLEVGPL